MDLRGFVCLFDQSNVTKKTKFFFFTNVMTIIMFCVSLPLFVFCFNSF